MRRMAFASKAWTSPEWLAIGRLLFGVNVNGSQPFSITDAFLARLVEESKHNAGYRFTSDFKFYCSTCDKEFTSPVTPRVCSLCGRSADDEPQAVSLTHVSYTAKTFPFFAPAE